MIYLAYGMPGAGKSTLLHDIAKRYAPAHRLFVMDHEAGWGSDGVHWRGKPPLITLVEGEDALQDMEEIPSGELKNGLYVFRNVEPQDVSQLAVDKGNIIYVDDEIDMLARQKGWLDSPIRLMVHQGRHLPNEEGDVCELHVMGACRRPQNLHTDITSFASDIFTFRIQGHRTLKRLVEDSTIREEDWETVEGLENFHFLHWKAGRLPADTHLNWVVNSIPPLGQQKTAPAAGRGADAGMGTSLD